MKINATPDTLVTITVDKEGLETMINAATAAITSINEWNMGDEYDTDVTPYHELLIALRERYESVYGEIS
jgi:hypothetical protein